MTEFAKTVEDKALYFSVRIVNLCKFLTEEKHEFNISNQLFRSGTSIGANLAEAESAISKKDFLAKVYIALKESRETKYWLDLLYRTNYLAKKQYESISSDADEMFRLLNAITKTTKENLEKGSLDI
ncbi:MAG: four helix bundle protein [Prevotella sp.]|jgi:four helix bundle protein|nr:four helix bundle protein [Prevotella sp.]